MQLQGEKEQGLILGSYHNSREKVDNVQITGGKAYGKLFERTNCQINIACTQQKCRKE